MIRAKWRGHGAAGPNDTEAETDGSQGQQGRRWRWGRRRGHVGQGAGSCCANHDAPAGDGPADCPDSAQMAGKGAGYGGGQGFGQGQGQGRRHRRQRHAGPGFEGTSLNDVCPGDRCQVRALHGRGAIRQRLMDMGLVPNALLTVVRCAPLNDPIAVQVGTTLVSLRRADAAFIEVVHA